MSAYKADINQSPRVEESCDDPIVVVSNSKHCSVSSDYAGIGVAFYNVSWSRPVRLCYFSIPCKKWLLGFWTTLPEFSERFF